MGEDTPIDCEDKCAKWDIHNDFETVDGMPIYGGDLYDSNESDWEDPCDLAYAEYVERYNLDAPEGMELLIFERLKGPDESVMMVDEVTGLGYVHQTSSSSPLLEADIVCKKPVGQPYIMKVISVIRTVDRWRIVRGIHGRTGATLLFEMVMVDFHWIRRIRCRRLCSVTNCLG